MSDWLIPKPEDIDITEGGKEIHIYLESDSFGARYCSIEGEALKYLKKELSKKQSTS